MPRKSTRRSKGRARLASVQRFPPAYQQKPVGRLTLGFVNNQPLNAGSQTYAVGYDDLMYSVAVAASSGTAVPSTMCSLFASLRIRKIELWELNGNAISLTWSQVNAPGPYVSGPDSTKTDSGSVNRPSYVSLKPKAGQLINNWFSSSSTNNLFVVGISTTPSAGSGTTVVRMVLRVHVDYVLNDFFAFPTTITTSGSNTTVEGNLYWRIMNLGSGTVLFQPEAGTQVATYVS